MPRPPAGPAGVASPDVALAEDGVAPAEDGVAPAEDGVAPAEDGVAPAEDGVAPFEDAAPSADGAMAGFHPAVATWFHQRFPAGPTEPQAAAWPAVRRGADVLVAAATGSGKTLAAFLVAIDRAFRAAEAGEPVTGTAVVYVSPLKALAVDVHQNLEVPLAEIAAVARRLGRAVPKVSVGVRTGDTPASARSAMTRRPPTILVTTPESLYLMVTAERSRSVLGSVQTVIIDEVHAVARDKRGAHLALTLERLQHLQADRRLQRIGLSATQRPIDRVARLVTGGEPAAAGVVVVDQGSRRPLRLSVEVPGTELQAVASTEQLGDVVDRIAGHVARHRTTLIFVNSRRMSERLARLLGERLGPEHVAAHHGSLAAHRRLDVERRLRAGDLRALVATASLELGIDVGPVELVCQLGSPRLVSTFLQRVGRANHHRGGVPEGIVFPLSRDELVECVALVAGARDGRLDLLEPPRQPLDILVQQMVAEVAARGEWSEDDLFELVRRADHYRDLERSTFDELVALASEGIPTGHGRRLAYLHRDRVNGLLRPRRGARLAALTSGGAIPDTGDYRVVLDPDDAVIGSVNEDFAVESTVGDVFVLGTHSWRVRRVEAGIVRVVDAEGAAPTIPFWVGEAPSRSRQLSEEVSELRRAVASASDRAAALTAVGEGWCADAGVAEQVVDYLRAGMGQLGVMPSDRDVVFERFFDEAGGMQLVVHAPFGGRITRALGLALRKRLCATYDFELQAAAGDDALLLSLGAQHSFPLRDVVGLLAADRAPQVLAQAVLTSPMFPARWRFTLTRSLAVLRQRGGRRTPLPIQRMESEDVMAAVFPALAACQENTLPGPVTIPDHPLVRQAVGDCLHEAMDLDGLVEILGSMADGSIGVHVVDGSEPSVFAHEILDGKPFTFLDDAPLEERRSRAVPTRRGLPVPGDVSRRPDPGAVDAVAASLERRPRDAEELHDLLVRCSIHPPVDGVADHFADLVRSGRALTCASPGPHGLPVVRWCSVERRAWVEAALPGAVIGPEPSLGASRTHLGEPADADAAATDIVEGHLDGTGPTTAAALSGATGMAASQVRVALAALEHRGVALRGHFDERLPDAEQWCSRGVLVRIHAQARRRRRADIEPVTAQAFVRFLLAWQHVAPGVQQVGRTGVLAVVGQLQGFEAAAGAWEPEVLARRVESYRRQWLDDLCQSGRVAWGRLALRAPDPLDQARRGGATPSRSTPLTFTRRGDLPWLLAAARGGIEPDEPAHGAARDLIDVLRRCGASFHDELAERSRRLPADVEAGLWDLVARGLVTADGFASVRSLLDRRGAAPRRGGRRAARSRRYDDLRGGGDGRWSVLPPPAQLDVEDLAAAVARQLLDRWGIVFWDVVARETLALPWRHVVRALRRLEERGEASGGRFVTGFTGEQFAHPLAVGQLYSARHGADGAPLVTVNAVDPLNVAGIVLPGPRIPAVRTRQISFRDGLVVRVDDDVPAGVDAGMPPDVVAGVPTGVDAGMAADVPADVVAGMTSNAG